MMSFGAENTRDELLRRCEELLRLRTRQLFILMMTSERISRTRSLHKQLGIIAQGIVDAQLFRRALISIFGRNWKRIDMGYAGFSAEDIEALKRNKPLSPAMWRKVLSEKYRVSESYYIPHDDPLNKELGGVPSRISAGDFDGWHPDDYLFVPLRSRTGRIIGVISVDDPYDGKRPTPRSETLRLLELFAHRAASLIEHGQLLNRLRQQKIYLQKIINSSADVVVTTDRRGKIRVFNPAAQEIFGYSPSEIKGRSVLRLYKDPAKAREVMRKMRESGGSIKNEPVEAVSKSGEVIPLSLSASILYDEHGEEIGTLGVGRDLRPIRECELRMIGISLAHSINNCLQAQMMALSSVRALLEREVAPGLKRALLPRVEQAMRTALQVGEIIDWIKNPPEMLKSEKYTEDIEMYSLPLPELPELPPMPEVDLGGARILVADDDELLREGLAEFLRCFGAEVDTAEDGDVAIELLGRKCYDIVVSDVKMPRRSGYDVLRAVKEVCPQAGVVLMTAYGYDPQHTIVKAALSGHKDWFFKEKPFDPASLLGIVAKILADKRGKNEGGG